MKAKYIDFNIDTLYCHLMAYYKQQDEYTYVSLKKDTLRCNYKTIKKLLKNGGGENIKGMLERAFDRDDVVEVEVELIDDGVLIINDDDSDGEEYKYNDVLNMYFAESSKVFVRPDLSGAGEVIWLSYLKTLCA